MDMHVYLNDEYANAIAYPNPFHQSTTIRFSLREANDVDLLIYNGSGEIIETLLDDHLQPGVYQQEWSPGGYPPGLYYYKLLPGSAAQVIGKLVFIQ